MQECNVQHESMDFWCCPGDHTRHCQQWPYTLSITHGGLSMRSAQPGSNNSWYMSWYSIGAGPFDDSYPVSIRGTAMTSYNGWFSVCGLPASHAACTLDGQAAVADRPACSSLETCHRWIELTGIYG